VQSGKSAFNFLHFARLSQFLWREKKMTGYLPFTKKDDGLFTIYEESNVKFYKSGINAKVPPEIK